jgi:hypothetical protein
MSDSEKLLRNARGARDFHLISFGPDHISKRGVLACETGRSPFVTLRDCEFVENTLRRAGVHPRNSMQDVFRLPRPRSNPTRKQAKVYAWINA